MKRKYLILFLIVLAAGLVVFLIRGKSSGSVINLFSDNSNPKQISAVIVPHFDFFADKRGEYLANIAKDYQPKQIILVSVNHFDVGSANILTTKKDWQLSSGKINVDTDLFTKVTAAKLATADDTPFPNEHGIKDILPDIAKNFPNSQLLPLIIKADTSQDEVAKLADGLYNVCPDCLLVSSVDFSHYQPNSLAQIHDTSTLSALNAQDQSKIWQAETDSPQTLLLTLKWAKKFSDQNFSLFYNSNSGEVSKNDSIETTSTIIGSFSKTPKVATEKSSTFLIGGDLMFDRNVYHNYQGKLNTIFDNLGVRTFWGSDLALANLEGPISAKAIDDDWQSGSMIFNFPPETVNTLKYMHFNALSLANNHSSNAGQSGFQNTENVLGQAGIQYAGSQDNFDDSNLMRIKGDIPISVITLDQLVNPNQTKVVAMIKKEKAAGQFVIVMPHWGVEYQAKHDASQSGVAHSWIDAGADLVVGSHPHVTQDSEIYKNRPIIYSLGNLVFDQYFSKETQEGLLLGGTIKQGSLELSFFPIKSILSQPQMMTGAEKAAKIKTVIDIDSGSGFTKVRSDTIKLTF
jgi:poly-gamma-glutamate synthesis protein (capsule biosynthesis protein)